MKISKRAFLALAASVVLACLLFALQIVNRHVELKLLFLTQLPGWWMWVSLWGVHGSPTNKIGAYCIYIAANALAYWPIVFGLSFLIPSKRQTEFPFR
jgi:hypothetical protein